MELTSRKDKIRFLKELKAGTTTINSIMPKGLECWEEQTSPDELKDEIYKCGNMRLSYSQLLERMADLSGRVEFVLLHKVRKIPENTPGFVTLNLE